MFKTLSSGHSLSQHEAYCLMTDMAEKKLNEFQVSAVVGMYKNRGISLEELSGFRHALMDLCIPVRLNKPAIDVCGTGGDNKNTFNISTLSAFVLAASGVPVAKHGNHGASSVSGSSDILKHFGYTFKTSAAELNADLEKNNLCFIHAPFFHPALGAVAPVRKGLGISSFFNLLGPLVNPANPQYRYIGTFNAQIARMYHYMLMDTGLSYTIVHSVDGYDEISLTGDVKVYANHAEHILAAKHFCSVAVIASELNAGEGIASAAAIFLNVLENKATYTQKQAVIANTAMAMQCYDPLSSLETCLLQATETIESGKALSLFKKIIQN